MRTIKTTTGADVALDGDLLAVMEALYREVTAKRDARAHRSRTWCGKSSTSSTR